MCTICYLSDVDATTPAFAVVPKSFRSKRLADHKGERIGRAREREREEKERAIIAVWAERGKESKEALPVTGRVVGECSPCLHVPNRTRDPVGSDPEYTEVPLYGKAGEQRGHLSFGPDPTCALRCLRLRYARA